MTALEGYAPAVELCEAQRGIRLFTLMNHQLLEGHPSHRSGRFWDSSTLFNGGSRTLAGLSTLYFLLRACVCLFFLLCIHHTRPITSELSWRWLSFPSSTLKEQLENTECALLSRPGPSSSSFRRGSRCDEEMDLRVI